MSYDNRGLKRGRRNLPILMSNRPLSSYSRPNLIFFSLTKLNVSKKEGILLELRQK